MIFGRINPQYLEDYWPRCREMLANAFRQKVHIHNVDDYYDLIKEGSLQLWAAIENENLIGAIVTSLDEGSEAKICSIMSLGGDRLEDWIYDADKALDKFAEDNQCFALEYVGRRGFSILVPEYQEDGVVYVKIIGDKYGKEI